jgi:predicted TIM-barrel fold metal-dependent hydrolase
MSAIDTQDRAESATAPATDLLLVDTDVHESLRSAKDLLPYLDSHWQRYITQYGWNNIVFACDWPYTVPHVARADWRLADGTRGTDLEAMQRHVFDDEKVTHAILCGLFHVSSQRGFYEFATALATAYNDWQIENWLDRDPRLLGSVHVVAHDPQAAAREIDRVAAHPQIVQVFLPTVTDREYGDPYYHPIFEAAIRNDLVVSFHHARATRAPLGYPRHYIEWKTIAIPMGAASQALSLIFNGVFEKYPELKVVFLEAGVTWVQWFMWRADSQYRETRLEVPWCKRLPSDYMRDHVRISTQPIGDIKSRELIQLVEATQAERMFLFSTDYPHYDADSASVLRALPEDLHRRIRYENALETYPRLAQLGS